jgi:hypothetical protein
LALTRLTSKKLVLMWCVLIIGLGGCAHSGSEQKQDGGGTTANRQMPKGKLIGLDNNVATPCKKAVARRTNRVTEIAFVVRCATAAPKPIENAFYISAETGSNETLPVPKRVPIGSFAHILRVRGGNAMHEHASCEPEGSERLLACGAKGRGEMVMTGRLRLGRTACDVYVAIVALAQGREGLRLKQLFDRRPGGCRQ